MLQRKKGQTAYEKNPSSLDPLLAKNVFYMHVYVHICVYALLLYSHTES